MSERFEIKNGKFGAYFYDSERDLDMSLKDVLERLNSITKTIEELQETFESFES